MKCRVSQIKYFLLLLLIAGTYSCEEEFSPFVSGLELDSIEEIIEMNEEDFSYFLQLVENGNLKDALNTYNPYGNDYTLFLPNDEAFEKFFVNNDTYKNIEDLLNDKDYSETFVKYHILNRGIRSNDFPFGAFSDTTLSGDLLSVGFLTGLDSTLFLINNVAPIIKRDIEARNGYVHVLDEVLIPVVYTSYELIKSDPRFSILTSVFELTNVNSLMGLTIEKEDGRIIENKYTLLAEPDSIYNLDSIYSLEDLIQKVSSDDNDYTSDTNPLYQFAAYHLLEDVYFLDGFEGNKNYNTFSALPIKIAAGAIIKINDAPNFHVFDTIIDGADTSYINYIEPIYNVSNTLSKNGAVHIINHVLYPYKPANSFLAFEFLNDGVIKEMSRKNGTYQLTEKTPLTYLSWEGPEEMIYYKTSGGQKALNKDYIQIEGDFVINYEIPRVFPGTYEVTLNANSNYSGNAIVEVFIDGKKIGGNVNLTTGANSSEVYREVFLGTVEYTEYVTHSITVRSILPGRFTWDFIKFDPI